MSKILIIEDEAAIRRVILSKYFLRSDTYQVEDAEDGVLVKIKK
jgi:CheY-like chemotaxis protein